MSIQWISSSPEKQWVKLSSRPGRQKASLTVGTNDLQRWEGFGGCFNELGWIALSKLKPADRKKVFHSLFSSTGCAFTRCRLPIGASDYAAEWYSHNETDGDYAMRHFSIARDRQYLIPYIREALRLQPDLEFFASPWSPPTWMKFPKAHNYGTMIWTPAILKAYALYFVKFIQAYAREGIAINQIHPQNEPVADQKFPSCLWTGEQLREFIVRYLGPALRKAGLKTELWLGTLNTDDFNGFIQAVLMNPTANRYIAGVGFQWAGRGAIQRTHKAWPGKRLMQTENECGDGTNTWDYAHYIFGLMQHYIMNGANAYIYWNMVLENNAGLSTWGWKQNSMISIDTDRRRIIYNPEFYIMRHFAQFIGPGAVHVELTGLWSANAVAFRNPNGRRVMVVQNPFPTVHPVTLDTVAGRRDFTLPPRSINTIVIG